MAAEEWTGSGKRPPDEEPLLFSVLGDILTDPPVEPPPPPGRAAPPRMMWAQLSDVTWAAFTNLSNTNSSHKDSMSKYCTVMERRLKRNDSDDETPWSELFYMGLVTGLAMRYR